MALVNVSKGQKHKEFTTKLVQCCSNIKENLRVTDNEASMLLELCGIGSIGSDTPTYPAYCCIGCLGTTPKPCKRMTRNYGLHIEPCWKEACTLFKYWLYNNTNSIVNFVEAMDHGFWCSFPNVNLTQFSAVWAQEWIFKEIIQFLDDKQDNPVSRIEMLLLNDPKTRIIANLQHWQVLSLPHCDLYAGISQAEIDQLANEQEQAQEELEDIVYWRTQKRYTFSWEAEPEDKDCENALLLDLDPRNSD